MTEPQFSPRRLGQRIAHNVLLGCGGTDTDVFLRFLAEAIAKLEKEKILLPGMDAAWWAGYLSSIDLEARAEWDRLIDSASPHIGGRA